MREETKYLETLIHKKYGPRNHSISMTENEKEKIELNNYTDRDFVDNF
jgi:hypothetical protein